MGKILHAKTCLILKKEKEKKKNFKRKDEKREKEKRRKESKITCVLLCDNSFLSINCDLFFFLFFPLLMHT